MLLKVINKRISYLLYHIAHYTMHNTRVVYTHTEGKFITLPKTHPER